MPRTFAHRLERLKVVQAEVFDQQAVLLRRAGLATLLVTTVIAGVFALGNIRLWVEWGEQRPLTLDFALYRACAIQGIDYGWNRLYDVPAQQHVYAAQEARYPWAGKMAFAPNVCTPIEGWLALPFVGLQLQTGYLIWSIAMFLATAGAFLVLAPGSVLAKLAQTALALCPYLVLLNLSEGQVTSFEIAGVAACWLLLKRGHDGWAGVVLALLVLKPQTLALVPLTLLASGRVRTFTAWLVTMAIVGAAVVANLGFDGSVAYLHRLQYASTHPAEYLGGPWYNLPLHFQTRFGRTAVQILAAASVLWLAFRHRRSGPEIPIAVGLVGSLLIAPYLHLDDFITVFPAVWLVLRAQPRLRLWCLAAAGYGVALLCTDPGTPRWGEGLLLFEICLLLALAVLPPSEESRLPERVASRRGSPLHRAVPGVSPP